MAKTFIGKACKLFSVLIAAAVLAGCVFMFTACESKNPEISVKFSFNEKEYTVGYKLYRSYAPATVAHYIELIDMKYFDKTVIHDFKEGDRMIGGGYTYEDMNGGDIMDDLTALDYDAFTTDEDGVSLKNISLWKDSECDQALNRLYGETSSNGFKIENGGLTQKFGSLGTYTYAYGAKNEDGMKEKVYTPSSKDQSNGLDYYKNSFQGMFYIYTGSSSSSVSDFCMFGELKDEEAKTALNDLLDAITAYVTDNELDSFTETKEDSVIQDSMVGGGSYDPETDFEVPQCRIILKEVKVTKY